DGEHRLEDLLAVEVGTLRLALLQRFQRLLALLGGEAIEILAQGFARPGIGRRDAGGEEFARRERKLIAVFGLGFAERAGAIHFRAAAPGAGQLAIDERRHAALAARRRERVG